MRSSRTRFLCLSNPKIVAIDPPFPLTKLGWHARTSLSANGQRIIWLHQTPCRRLAGKTLATLFPLGHCCCCCRSRRLTGAWPFEIYCNSKWHYFVSVSVIETRFRNLGSFYFLTIEMNHYSLEVRVKRGNWAHSDYWIGSHCDRHLPKLIFVCPSQSAMSEMTRRHDSSGLLLCYFYLLNFCPGWN